MEKLGGSFQLSSPLISPYITTTMYGVFNGVLSTNSAEQPKINYEFAGGWGGGGEGGFPDQHMRRYPTPGIETFV